MTQEPHEHYWVLDHSVIDLEDENWVLYRCSICPATMTYKEAKEVSPMMCPVEFCRLGNCLPLPEGADVNRASGEVLCECGRKLREHRHFYYPSGLGHCVQDCQGRFWHL